MKICVKFIAISLAALAGCMSIKVEDKGYEVLRDASGLPLVDKDGKVQLAHRGQYWSIWKHWVNQSAEEFNFSRAPGDTINLGMKNYKDEVSAELDKLIESCFEGASELAAKVAAAIATSGGSVAGEAGYTALKNCIGKFIRKGGDASKATVNCTDGNCTITDGTITCDGGKCWE